MSEALRYVLRVLGLSGVTVRREQGERPIHVMERERRLEPDERPMAAPRPVRRFSHHACAHRVEIDVTDNFDRVCLVFDDLRAEPPLEQMAGDAVASVEELAVLAAQPLHASRDRPSTNVGDEVDMIRHQAVPGCSPAVPVARLVEEP